MSVWGQSDWLTAVGLPGFAYTSAPYKVKQLTDESGFYDCVLRVQLAEPWPLGPLEGQTVPIAILLYSSQDASAAPDDPLAPLVVLPSTNVVRGHATYAHVNFADPANVGLDTVVVAFQNADDDATVTALASGDVAAQQAKDTVQPPSGVIAATQKGIQDALKASEDFLGNLTKASNVIAAIVFAVILFVLFETEVAPRLPRKGS